MDEIINLADVEEVAKAKLPAGTYAYFAGGAGDEVTLRENRSAFDRLRIHYRVLVDVSHRDLTTSLFGQQISMPVLIAPTAFHRLAHPDGELATVRASGTAGTIMVLSSLSNTRLEEVSTSATGPVWFQLYVNQDRGFTRDLVQCAEAAGFRALVVTVDTPDYGRREREARTGFHLPPGLSAINLIRSNERGEKIGRSGAGMGQAFAWMLEPSLNWKDVEWLRGLPRLPVLLKGVCRADDAESGLEHGAAGIIVSNHGGRQMDTAPATISVLPAIA